MLHRDLTWVPREKQRYWDCTAVQAGENTIFVEKPIAHPHDYIGVIWVPGLHTAESIARCLPDGFVAHDCSDEFEAQAVLDHYLQTIGPSDDPS